jgi:type IV secretion system protein VirB10
MRSFFSSSPDDPVAVSGAPGGWAGLSGWNKLAIVSGVAVAALGVVMWPNFGSNPASKKPVPAEQHPPAQISDYQAPPPVQDVAARVMGGGPAAPQGMLQRPVATEMSLYVAKAPLPPSPSPTAAQGASSPDSADRSALAPNAAVPTNHATIVTHPDYVIRAGDVIPCLPVDAQNSSRPSFTTCRVPVWFRGTNQRRGLLPPGARLFGQIREGLSAGQERLGISYSLIQTPWFNMPIAAPAGDALGRGGVDGDVNTFFWDRAGAVGLYALMDAAVGVGQNAATNALTRSFGGNGTTLDFSSPSQSLASREFDATINKPPVLTRDEALPVTVTVGQDLDFFDACKQAMRVDPMACPLQ